MASWAPSGREHRGNGNIVLLLSLNLILLAFFILLNSLSEFEAAKTRAVMESVNRAFSGKIQSTDQVPAFNVSLGALSEVQAKFREVGSLFEAIIPASKSKRIQRAKAVRVEVPAASLFEPKSVELVSARVVLIQGLAKALSRKPKDGPSYDLEVLLGVGEPAKDAPVTAARFPRSLEVRRAAVLARHLVDEGLPAGALAIGLLPNHPGMVRFVVRVRQGPAPSAWPEYGPEAER